jgi:hypothetical protein
MISSLAAMVKKAADQQIEMVLDLSKEMSKHNKLLEKALERQDKMI